LLTAPFADRIDVLRTALTTTDRNLTTIKSRLTGVPLVVF
jgi:hypothetical protein